MSNREKFEAIYREELLKAVAAHPDQYAYSIDHCPTVANRMMAALDRSYNKDSHAFRATCERLGIKHTYAAINAFVKG